MQLPEKQAKLVFDTHKDAPRGFAVKLTKAGGKSFVLRYSVDGRRRLKTIGQYPTWTVEAARKEAHRLLQALDQGVDPLEVKRLRKLEPTVADLADEWLEKHASGLVSEGDIRRYILSDLVPAMGAMKVSSICRRDVIEVVEKKAGEAPRSAALLLGYTKKLFEYAVDQGVITASPVAGLKPASIKVPGRRNALAPVVRDRVLDGEEIKTFWNESEGWGLHKLTALALKLILVTGQRPGEVAGMKWNEVKGDLWTIPAERRGKTGTAHSVYLPQTAQHILKAAKLELERLSRRRKAYAKEAVYVFETRPGASLTVHALSKATNRLGLGWTPHDLRRTMRTGLSACKVRPDIAEMVIGHSKRGIIAVYDLHEFEDERREAMSLWESRLLEMVSDNVVAFPVVQGDARSNHTDGK